ncbi:hypothetical protein P3W24_01790 [Luteibacter sp. PPL201]|jgi:hypothetical protein|uniref:DUF5666 domain-containing protein n=1 Tax=Luteibacter sahnii TaxID=3021977 RepID=A0ABT6B6H7_9GAMM|nr:hypothetical protein [Luteibacter sp. PPL193]MDY1548352.1 hypothetical protein [Luteibacter sp. PPL193]
MRLWSAFIIPLCAWAAYAWWPHAGAGAANDRQAAFAPAQHALGDAKPVALGRFTLQPRASFSMTARVLSREDYQLDDLAPLAPTDLALGWGPMAEGKVLRRIRISQSNRLYYWYTDDYPIPRKAIESSSANMHMVPANDNMAARLREVRPGEVIHVEGMLVDVRRDDGWHLATSLARDDEGPGSSEIVLIERLEERQ